MQPRLPIGFWDPAVIGELTEGNIQPLRLFEYEAIRGREEPVDEAEIAKMRSDIQGFMPETLASASMPGYEFLGIGETMLGPLSAVTFEYRWDGLKPGSFGGDHGFIVWAMAPLTMFHVYHHCSGDQWEPRKPELDAILASFQVLEPADSGTLRVLRAGGREDGPRRRVGRRRSGRAGGRRGRGAGGGDRAPGRRDFRVAPRLPRQGAKNSRRTSRSASASLGASAPRRLTRRACLPSAVDRRRPARPCRRTGRARAKGTGALSR